MSGSVAAGVRHSHHGRYRKAKFSCCPIGHGRRHEDLDVSTMAPNRRAPAVVGDKARIALCVVGDEAAPAPGGGPHEAAETFGLGCRQGGKPRPAGDGPACLDARAQTWLRRALLGGHLQRAVVRIGKTAALALWLAPPAAVAFIDPGQAAKNDSRKPVPVRWNTVPAVSDTC